MNGSIRKFENLHIALWLVKDTFWVLDFKVLGVMMIFPTLFLAFYITYKFKNRIAELYHNVAVCFWIIANTTWMLGEFYFNDTFRPYSTFFFIAGFLVIAYFYIFKFKYIKANLDI
jgi:hypothetical protein